MIHEHRIGECRACHARFRIPASFSAERARCRECGGTVVIEDEVTEGDAIANDAHGREGRAPVERSNRDRRRAGPPHAQSNERHDGRGGGRPDPRRGERHDGRHPERRDPRRDDRRNTQQRDASAPRATDERPLAQTAHASTPKIAAPEMTAPSAPITRTEPTTRTVPTARTEPATRAQPAAPPKKSAAPKSDEAAETKKTGMFGSIVAKAKAAVWRKKRGKS